ncbi:hypothetical protein ART_1200 [Arthrobacter sp. PAMC 25486]|uniref:hypothetical protein n=1 Tax=Arthrobacter sp. PAMC 25486 TaxID=1494608 RepID=UPI000535DC78|nr:hypothetical protein [Arthrobacter sp. PAMC 25486]AIY00799.1 hypothetical protein ART_1200 [Arthrobacter sp. PAMC 25486]
MASWEAFYDASLTAGLEWQSPQLAAEFTVTGDRLAQRLADELGSGFAVEFHSYEPGATRTLFSSGSPATNAAAAAALLGLVRAEEELQARLRSDTAPGGSWSAYAPLPGTVFGSGSGSAPGSGSQVGY